MSKYIIDIPKTVGVGEVGSVHYTYFDGIQVQTIVLKGDEIEELTADYINEHFGDLQDTAYKRGINDGSLDVKQRVEAAYQRGLDDAWEAARKIANMWMRIGNDELLAIFGITERIGQSTLRSLFEEQTANEAMLGLEAYEEKQKDVDKIEVGDEVIYNGTTKCIVVRPEDDERYASLIDSDGTHYSADHRECKKTGRHFDIQSILEEMQHD